MSRRRRSNHNKGTLTYHENIFDNEDYPTQQTNAIQLIQYITAIIKTGFKYLGGLFCTVLGFYLAIFLMIKITQYFSRFLYTTLLDTACPIIPSPILSFVPACKHWNQPIPNFSQLAKVQENLCNSVLQQYPNKYPSLNPSSFGGDGDDDFMNDDLTTTVSPLILKQVELATRDLQVMIKHSNLALADVLESKLGEYLIHSRSFGRDVQSMQSKTRGVIDNLITYNKITLRKLSDVEKGITSRQELKLIYEKFMELIEKEAKRLILSIEKAQGTLNILEEDLYAIHEITIREKSYQRSSQPHILADLGNLVRGKELQRPLVQSNLELLMEYDAERMKASRRLIILLDRMESVQMDLEELRTKIVTPLLIPDSLSLEVHIENINKAIDRLKQGKLVNYESIHPSETGLPSSTLHTPTFT